MHITAEMLRAKNACDDQVAIFEKEWPAGVEVTAAVVWRAVELELDIHWFAAKFLPTPAWAEYEKAIAAARAEYYKAVAPAWAEYEKAVAPALIAALNLEVDDAERS